MTRRRKARFIALNILYIADMLAIDREKAGRMFYSSFPVDSDADVTAYSKKLIDGVTSVRDTIDSLLAATLENWSLKRLSCVDRNVLRLGVFELLYVPETPPKVVLNEAIEMAKSYGQADSGRFVNGVLDKIRKSEGNKSGKERVPEKIL